MPAHQSGGIGVLLDPKQAIAIKNSATTEVKDAAIIAWPTSEPKSLLLTAAALGFWDIPKTGLVKIAKDLDIDIGGAVFLSQVLFALVSGVLGQELSAEKKDGALEVEDA